MNIINKIYSGKTFITIFMIHLNYFVGKFHFMLMKMSRLIRKISLRFRYLYGDINNWIQLNLIYLAF